MIPGDPKFARSPPLGEVSCAGGSCSPSPCAGAPDHSGQPITLLPQVLDWWKVASQEEGAEFWAGSPPSWAGCAAPLLRAENFPGVPTSEAGWGCRLGRVPSAVECSVKSPKKKGLWMMGDNSRCVPASTTTTDIPHSCT